MPSPAQPIKATLFVDVINNGNKQSTTPFTVTAYADQALTNPIGVGGGYDGPQWVHPAHGARIGYVA